MFALVISINGTQVLTAGVEDWDLLHTDIMAKREKGVELGEYELNVTGLPVQVEKGKLEHLRWGRRPLKVGDEVTIRLAEVTTADAPIKRYRSDREVQEDPFTEEEVRQRQWETYLALKEKFEGGAK
jgi:hypothetical protein